jgi:hypothetical protein
MYSFIPGPSSIQLTHEQSRLNRGTSAYIGFLLLIIGKLALPLHELIQIDSLTGISIRIDRLVFI